MTTEELIDTLKVHRFEPGDRLIVKLAQHISYEGFERLRRQLELWAPGVKVAVLDPGVEFEVARGLEAAQTG